MCLPQNHLYLLALDSCRNAAEFKKIWIGPFWANLGEDVFFRRRGPSGVAAKSVTLKFAWWVFRERSHRPDSVQSG
jgi:hypothetical protein